MRFLSVVEGFLGLFSNLRPVWFKRLILSFFLDLLSCGVRLRLLFSQLLLQVSIVSGIEKQTGKTISVLFVGGKKFPVMVSERIFREEPTVKQQNHVFIWGIKDLKERYSSRVDAIIVSCDQWYQRFLRQDDFFVFPHMVDMVLDTSKELKELIHGLPHSTKEDVRKVNKKGFSFEISSDQSKLKTFYVDMYLPTLKNRIGETDVLIPDFVFLKYLQESGYELMVVSLEGKEVCGVMFQKKHDIILLKYAGVLQGDMELIKKGAFSAFYYFFMVYAKDQKVNLLDFGGTRPFFDDGLFQYKRKWGMKVEPCDLVREIFGLRIVRESEPLKQFLIHNPFIGMNEKNELIEYVFVDKKTFTDVLGKQVEKRCQMPGLNKVRFITL